MLIIIDQKISANAKEKLSSFGELMELRTEGLTYPAISGHPDIFFCQAPGKLIVAPNLPAPYFDKLKKHNIEYITGESLVGANYPSSARYNAVATSNYLIHNFRHTDPVITRAMKDLIPVHVEQAYCRCNLLPLKDDHFITSDYGIQKTKTYPNSTFNIQPSTFSESCFQKVLFVSPEDILLEGFPHGFFGGCCGVWDDIVFINGSLKFFKDGKKVRDYLESLSYKILELHPAQLIDCGSILII